MGARMLSSIISQTKKKSVFSELQELLNCERRAAKRLEITFQCVVLFSVQFTMMPLIINGLHFGGPFIMWGISVTGVPINGFRMLFLKPLTQHDSLIFVCLSNRRWKVLVFAQFLAERCRTVRQQSSTQCLILLAKCEKNAVWAAESFSLL